MFCSAKAAYWGHVIPWASEPEGRACNSWVFYRQPLRLASMVLWELKCDGQEWNVQVLHAEDEHS